MTTIYDCHRRLMLTFANCLHRILRDQTFQTDRIPLTDITVILYDLWASWPNMNVVYLRNDKSGSADLLTSATKGSQPRIHDGIPRKTHQTVTLQTVLIPLFPEIEQQCKQLQDIQTSRTSQSRRPLWCNNLSATSFTLTPPTPESSSSPSPVDRSQPLHRESLRPSGDAGISPPPYVATYLTMSFFSGVHRCVVFTGSEDPRCSCSGSTRGNTSLALFPPTPEGTSSSSPVDRSQPLHRESLRPSDDAGISPPPYVAASLTRSFISGVHRCVVFTGSGDPRYSCSGSTRGNTSLALFPPTPEGTSSSSPVDRSQPLHRESLRPSDDAGISPPPYVAASLTMRYISGVNLCVVFTGSEDPCCSCSWSTRGSTPFALFPPTPECMSSSSPVESFSLCVENCCARRATHV